ncbi:MAG: hypothetical protein NTY12_02485 [Candidatus Falkowbacteria bacterium]|nr:hypothetical protein [Candidatus Falkowbacteria bacterium]
MKHPFLVFFCVSVPLLVCGFGLMVLGAVSWPLDVETSVIALTDGGVALSGFFVSLHALSS